jgi:ABC-type Fe3+/spermidine/putrescine transport system ATPase subunit
MIELSHISKRFGEREVLRDLSLELPGGEFAILLGPSGSGKTLLLAILAGLEAPTSGRVLIGGQDVTRLPPERRQVTMVFQRHALFPHLTVFENIAFSLRARREPHGVVAARTGELLELVGLQAYARARPDVLSGGQCQRVAFARALAADAEVILFDEPLNSLDVSLKGGLMAELKRLHRERGFTALYVTHERSEALALGDRVFELREGRVMESGTPEEAFDAALFA